MKILGFTVGGNSVTPTPPQPSNNGFYNFTSPFLNVGKGNLSLPYITPSYTGVNGYVRFGEDNLFPNLLRQLYHTSPLHSSIVNFTVNATVGGGFKYENTSSTGVDKVALYKFENDINIKKLIRRITKDALMFDNINLLISNDANGKAKTVKRIPMDELRWDETESKFAHCKDYSRNINVKYYDKYKVNEPNSVGIYSVRMDDGDSIYPIPSYASANNWIFLDGESSFLHKSNILNSIFPSTIFKFPKKPASDEELQQYKKTIESAKGAQQAGRAIAFFENGPEDLPIIESLPTSDNDKLFLQTDERTDAKICQAWTIDPILMGIRVSGKLGSGSDIKQSYIIWEKNIVMPLRNEIEEVMDFLMTIFNIKGSFKLNNYQIINEEIIVIDDAETTKVNDALNSMSPLVATKILETMTPNQILALVGLPAIKDGDVKLAPNTNKFKQQ